MRMLILANMCLVICANTVGAEPLNAQKTECVFKFNANPVCIYKTGKYTITVSLVTKPIAENEIELTQITIDVDGKKYTHNLSPDTSMTDSDTGIVIFEDINFDGMPDLAISTSFGVANQYFDYWIYDKQSSAYFAVGNFPKLKLDPLRKTLTASVKINAAAYETQIFSWQGKKLVKSK